MTHAIRRAVAVLVLAVVGCGPSARDATPNPALKVPDIPPGGHDAKPAAKGQKPK